MSINYPCIAKGNNDILLSDDGQEIIDLFSANGATWLGHSNKQIISKVTQQLEKVWLTGGLRTSIRDEAFSQIESFFPSSHRTAGLYSTGMEAAEFALRVARVLTNRNDAIGFEKCMHGKSLATAYLGWDNQDNLHIPFLHRLPFVSNCPEINILQKLEALLAQETISAVFLEPLQATGGGYMASTYFYQEVYRLCQKYHTLLVWDEILTGFYRTGEPFFFSSLGFIPDLILIGKALGNGFPVSGVVLNRQYPIEPSMLPGSTFAGNPLASTAVVETLRQMQSLNLSEKVSEIEKIIGEHLNGLEERGMTVRGRGAIWVIELPPQINAENVVVNIYKQGVFVSYTSHLIRILPAATINLDNLTKACTIVKDELLNCS